MTDLDRAQLKRDCSEEVFVLEGRVRFEDSWYEAGYYLYSPSGSMDDVYLDIGGVLFVSRPKPHVDM